MRYRAFSLVELAVSMAIAGIVVAAATTAAVNVTRLLKLEGKKSIADQDSRRLVDFVVGRMQVAGGGSVRPWMAMWHEQGCAARNGLPACDGHDRLTIVDVDTLRTECEVVSATATTLVFPDAVDGVCCFDWPLGALEDPEQADQFSAQPLMLVNGRNMWTMVVATDAGEHGADGGDGCTYGLTGVRPLAGWADTTAALTGFAGGVAVPVATRTLYLGAPQPAADAPVSVRTGPTTSTLLPPDHLLEWFDDNNDAFVSDGEIRVVFPGVYDFQLALGFDEPENGRVIDAASTSDEWWGNAAETGNMPFERSGLRMGNVGVIVGVKAVDPGQKTLSVLNGPAFTRSNHVMRKAVGKAMLRNIAVFY